MPDESRYGRLQQHVARKQSADQGNETRKRAAKMVEDQAETESSVTVETKSSTVGTVVE